ncbi:unnamed protein product [Sphagnum balticum]
MQLYTESTDGSYIEYKESALVWHHQFADPDFGSWQAKELQNHLESVLASEPVTVKSGAQIVEVMPQGVTKEVVVEKLLIMMEREHCMLPDLILCVGDDRSDEGMFESIKSLMNDAPSAEVFACTVGQKPSKAKYYLDDTVEVIKMLQGLARIGALYDNFGTEKAVEYRWNVPTQYNCKESLTGTVSMMVVMDLSTTSTTDGHKQHNRAWSLHWPFQKHLSVIFSRLMGWKENYFYSSSPTYQLIQLRVLGSIQEQPCRSHLQGAAYIGHVPGLTVGAQH